MGFFQLIGNAMAGALDVCVGMLSAALLAHSFDIEFTPWLFLFGAFFALLPDSDLVFPILGGNVEGDHRVTLTHRPALMVGLAVLLGTAVSLYAGTFFWLACSIACLLWHYLHDTAGWYLGSGSIAWKWPLTPTRYTFMGEAVHEETNHAQWIEATWLRPSTHSRKELSIASLCLGIAVAVPYGGLWGIASAAAAASSVALVWGAYALYATRAR